MGSISFFLRSALKAFIILTPLIYYGWFERYKVITILVFVVIFFIVEFFAIYKPTKKNIDRNREICDQFFGNWISGAKFNGKKPKLRINIMLKKFHIINCHFFQYYQLNMKEYPDSDLHFSIHQGFVGECFKKDVANAPYYNELRDLKGEEIFKVYKFNKKLYEKTKHIKAITCSPLQKEKMSFWRRGVKKYKKFGVLNVDAVDDVGADYLKEKEVLREIDHFRILAQIIYT